MTVERSDAPVACDAKLAGPRQLPGLWHLVLFAWNRDDAAKATILE